MRVLGVFLTSLALAAAAPQVIFLLPRHFLQNPQPGEPNPFENLNIQELLHQQASANLNLAPQSNLANEAVANEIIPNPSALTSPTPEEILPVDASSITLATTQKQPVSEPILSTTLNPIVSTQVNLIEPQVKSETVPIAEKQIGIKPQEVNTPLVELIQQQPENAALVAEVQPTLLNPQPTLLNPQPTPVAQHFPIPQPPQVAISNPTASFILDSPLRHLSLGSIAIPNHLLPLTPRQLIAKAAEGNLSLKTPTPITGSPIPSSIDTTVVTEPTSAFVSTTEAISTAPIFVETSSSTPVSTSAQPTTNTPEITTFAGKRIVPAQNNLIQRTLVGKGKSLLGQNNLLESPQSLQQIGSSVVQSPASFVQPTFDPRTLVDPRFRQFIYPNDSPQVIAAKIALFRIHAAASPQILTTPSPVVA